MLHTSHSKKNNGPNVSYYTLSMTNNTLSPAPLQITQTSDQPIIDNPNDYEMSIVRFTVPGQSLPIFKFILDPTESDPLQSNYAIGIIYNNGGTKVGFAETLDYLPSRTDRENPTKIDYNVYSYEIFIKMINNSFSKVFDDFNTAFPQANRNKPFIKFDSVTGLLSVNLNNYWSVTPVSGAYTTSNDGLPEIQNGEAQIWINSALYTYLRGFNWYFCELAYGTYPLTVENIVLSLNYMLYPIDISPDPTPSTTVYPICQQFSTLGSWNDVVSIVVSTAAIPVIRESFPLVDTDYKQSDVLASQINISGTVNVNAVISDFAVADAGTELFQTLEYLPSAEYRIIALSSGIPLKTIDFNFQWLDRYNKFNQMYLGCNENATIKVMFRKKTECRCD